MSKNFFLHFTPDFSNAAAAGGKENGDDDRDRPRQRRRKINRYKYMNKPCGLKHWMEQGVLQMSNSSNKTTALDTIVILMDPDMILLRPIQHNFFSEQYLWTTTPKTNQTFTVRHGFPLAQCDGFITSSLWSSLNMTRITGTNIPRMPSESEGPLYWNTGPPYLATARDFYEIVTKWVQYTPRVLEEYPKLFAEMIAFILATIQLQLPFTLILSLVVSKTTTRNGEGWEFIDQLPNGQVCQPTAAWDPETKLPVILHYC